MTINMKQLKRTKRATFNHLQREFEAMEHIIQNIDSDSVAGCDIAAMRCHVEAMAQKLHEFSAYWNVINTHQDDQK